MTKPSLRAMGLAGIVVTLLVVLAEGRASAAEQKARPRPRPTAKPTVVASPDAKPTDEPSIAPGVILPSAIDAASGSPGASPPTTSEPPPPSPVPAEGPPVAESPPASTLVTVDRSPVIVTPVIVASSSSSPKMPLVLSLAAAAVAAAGAGTYFALASTASFADARQTRIDSQQSGRYCSGASGGGLCKDAADMDRAGGEERAAAIGLFAGAGAFGLSALVTYLAWPSARPSPITVGAAASPTGGSASATFRF
ncbi:MAG: hypothetical protein JST00_05105 [Deltaproteobacteria bacterium]|nr:hypothetical protein [Deltaproteobacteria bacterium]